MPQPETGHLPLLRRRKRLLQLNSGELPRNVANRCTVAMVTAACVVQRHAEGGFHDRDLAGHRRGLADHGSAERANASESEKERDRPEPAPGNGGVRCGFLVFGEVGETEAREFIVVAFIVLPSIADPTAGPLIDKLDAGYWYAQSVHAGSNVPQPRINDAAARTTPRAFPSPNMPMPNDTYYVSFPSGKWGNAPNPSVT